MSLSSAGSHFHWINTLIAQFPNPFLLLTLDARLFSSDCTAPWLPLLNWMMTSGGVRLALFGSSAVDESGAQSDSLEEKNQTTFILLPKVFSGSLTSRFPFQPCFSVYFHWVACYYIRTNFSS